MKLVAAGSALLALFACDLANAQVYKCATSAGTVYSQQPCGATAVEVKAPRAPRVDPDALARQHAAVFQSVDVNNASYAEQSCVRAAENSVLGPANQRIAGYRQQIAALQRDMGRANNNVAGATWVTGLRTQIAGIEQAIATERTAAASRMDGERNRCAEQKAKAVEEIQRRYAPAPAPTQGRATPPR